MKRLFLKASLMTIATILLTSIVLKLSESEIFRFIFPETTALEGFDLTDIVFKNRKDSIQIEQIVIINIGNLEEGE